MGKEVIKSFKAFDKDMKCRDFQYEVGKTYEESEAKACSKGFHGCENPFAVLKYAEDNERMSMKEYAVAAAMIVALVIMCGLAEAVIR